MPLTAKGEIILRALQQRYGAKKGESILYAGKNAGTFTGIDAASDAAVMSVLADIVGGMCERMDALIKRADWKDPPA